MPGFLTSALTGFTDRAKGKGQVSSAWLNQIGRSSAQAAGGGCLFAAVAIAASGTITFTANPSANDTITIGTTTWTFVASGASGTQTNIKATLALTLAQLVTDLLASADAQIVKATYEQNGTVLNVNYLTPGTGGNSFALAASVATASGTTLAGGGVPSAFTAFANGADTTEDTLLTTTIPQNFFDVAGRNLEVIAWGNVTATSATKTVKLYLGNSMSQSIAYTTTQTGAWQMNANIWKSATNQQLGFIQMDSIGATTARSITNLVGGEFDASSFSVKVTGKSSAATAGLVTLYGVAIYGYN